MPSSLPPPAASPALAGQPLLRVLIVDDAPEDRLLYQRLLGRDRWCFVEAETGEEGLAFCQTQRPDCVLLDYQLPDLDGLEFLARISEIPGVASVPVIMLTGQGSESLAVQAIKHGVEDYLSKKNLTADRLRGALDSALEQRDLARKLQQTQERYTDLVNTIEGIVWEANAQTFQFTFVSPQAERLLGYPVAQWLREPTFWPDHLHPEDRAATVNYCAEATRQMRSHEIDYRMIAADGRVVWFHDLVTVAVENDRPVLLRGLMVDITSRKQAEEQINASLHEKEVLLKEVHHRVKNNLQIVSSLLNLQSRQLTDPVLIEIFASTRDRVRAMASVHEHLYGSGDFAQIDLAVQLGNLARMLMRSGVPAGATVQPALQLDPVKVDLNTAVPLSLIANELITNALKYALVGRRQGTLTLGLRAGGGHHELRIADDGPGFPAAFDPATSTTLGLRLVRDLARQIGGELEIDRSASGASVVVRWPARLVVGEAPTDLTPTQSQKI